jgi:hypothetical protein
VISSVVASTMRFTTLEALVSALSRAFRGWLAHHYEGRLLSGEIFSRVVKLLAGQGTAAEPFRDHPHVRAIHPF